MLKADTTKLEQNKKNEDGNETLAVKINMITEDGNETRRQSIGKPTQSQGQLI